MAENLKNLELQINPIFERIEAPNHRTFVAHELRMVSRKFEAFLYWFDLVSGLHRRRRKAARPKL